MGSRIAGQARRNELQLKQMGPWNVLQLPGGTTLLSIPRGLGQRGDLPWFMLGPSNSGVL